MFQTAASKVIAMQGRTMKARARKIYSDISLGQQNQRAGENKRKWSNVEVGILGELTLLLLTLLREWERDE